MDILFHGASSALLAGFLGERRPRWLVAAAVVGISPDALWVLSSTIPGWKGLYSCQHSLLVNVPVCLVLCCFNWRIAFGGMLHILTDVFTHASSTMHLFYPFSRVRYPIGLSWWNWPGLALWACLWLVLLTVIFWQWRKCRSVPGGKC